MFLSSFVIIQILLICVERPFLLRCSAETALPSADSVIGTPVKDPLQSGRAARLLCKTAACRRPAQQRVEPSSEGIAPRKGLAAPNGELQAEPLGRQPVSFRIDLPSVAADLAKYSRPCRNG